jgi:hypothetical protein
VDVDCRQKFGGRRQCEVWMYLCGGGGEEIDPADDPAWRSCRNLLKNMVFWGGVSAGLGAGSVVAVSVTDRHVEIKEIRQAILHGSCAKKS